MYKRPCHIVMGIIFCRSNVLSGAFTFKRSIDRIYLLLNNADVSICSNLENIFKSQSFSSLSFTLSIPSPNTRFYVFNSGIEIHKDTLNLFHDKLKENRGSAANKERLFNEFY